MIRKNRFRRKELKEKMVKLAISIEVLRGATPRKTKLGKKEQRAKQRGKQRGKQRARRTEKRRKARALK
jgi:hypothetical protein